MKKKFLAVTMAVVLSSLVMSIPAQAREIKKSPAVSLSAAKNTNRNDGQRCIDYDNDSDPGDIGTGEDLYNDDPLAVGFHTDFYLTALGNQSNIHTRAMRLGTEYKAHIPLYWIGEEGQDLENVRVKVGYYSINEYKACLIVNVEADGMDPVQHEYEIAVTKGSEGVIPPDTTFDDTTSDKEDYFYTLERTGIAKLYNDGHLNGAQVNHKDLLERDGILIGYDDQDGLMPSGEAYGCELVFKIQLVEIDFMEHLKNCPVPTDIPEECNTLPANDEVSGLE